MCVCGGGGAGMRQKERVCVYVCVFCLFVCVCVCVVCTCVLSLTCPTCKHNIRLRLQVPSKDTGEKHVIVYTCVDQNNYDTVEGTQLSRG